MANKARPRGQKMAPRTPALYTAALPNLWAKAPSGGQKATKTISVRIAAPMLERIDRAAQAADMTRTRFMLWASSSAANDILLDQNHFVLDEKAFQNFLNALDAPASAPSELADLLTQHDDWDVSLKA